jgi:hypothetical protein
MLESLDLIWPSSPMMTNFQLRTQLTACRNDNGVTLLRSQSSFAKMILSILSRSDTENEHPIAFKSSLAPGKSLTNVKNKNQTYAVLLTSNKKNQACKKGAEFFFVNQVLIMVTRAA